MESSMSSPTHLPYSTHFQLGQTMEAGSFAVGVLALAGSFNNAVDCFEYVQFGRNFSKTFQNSLLKLDVARLRLSRWGEAIGLSGDFENIPSLQEAGLRVPAEDIARAERILGQVLDLFAEAEEVSGKFKYRTKSDESSLGILDVQSDMDSDGQSLHEKMRNLSIKRQNRTALRQKVKWALYEQKHFRKLIADIVHLVTDLEQVFPGYRGHERKLCELEVSEIGVKQCLPLLKDIAASQDKDLEDAIAKSVQQQASGASTFNNYNSKVGQEIGIANNYGGQTFTF